MVRLTFAIIVLIETFGGISMAAEKPKDDLLDDYLLLSAKSQDEIVSWAKGKTHIANSERFDGFRVERFVIDGKKLLVLLASPPTATYRMTIFVYVADDSGDDQRWSLILVRYAGTADVKVEIDKKLKQLKFRSKAGKLLLILPVENLKLASFDSEE